MPFNSFSIGKDVTIDVMTPSGLLQLPVTVTQFNMDPIYKDINCATLGGEVLESALPAGWRGSIMLDRQDGTVDDFFAQYEAGYYAGQNIQWSQITETISEADGSISQYRYTKCSLKFEKAGDKKGDDKISQTIGVFASKRLKVV
jgi:hypothetical protein